MWISLLYSVLATHPNQPHCPQTIDCFQGWSRCWGATLQLGRQARWSYQGAIRCLSSVQMMIEKPWKTSKNPLDCHLRWGEASWFIENSWHESSMLMNSCWNMLEIWKVFVILWDVIGAHVLSRARPWMTWIQQRWCLASSRSAELNRGLFGVRSGWM